MAGMQTPQQSQHSSSQCNAIEKKQLDEIFLEEITMSLTKAASRKMCKYDCTGNQCYQKNPDHSSKFSHPNKYSMCDISFFKIDADAFLNNSYTIYNCNKEDFSREWYSEMSARRGAKNEQIATMEYDKYDSLIFLILANIIVNIEEYIELYGGKFLMSITSALESSDNTGLFYIDPRTELGKIMTKYSPKDPYTHKIDYRLGNSTIHLMVTNIINNNLINSRYRTPRTGGKRKTNSKRIRKSKTHGKKIRKRKTNSKRIKKTHRKTHKNKVIK